MVYISGMFLGAFFMLYCFYGWRYMDNRIPVTRRSILYPIRWAWNDMCTSLSEESDLEQVVDMKFIRQRNWVILFLGAWIGWGTTDGLMGFFR